VAVLFVPQCGAEGQFLVLNHGSFSHRDAMRFGDGAPAVDLMVQIADGPSAVGVGGEEVENLALDVTEASTHLSVSSSGPTTRRIHGRKVEVSTPLFFGYAFVLITLQWHCINGTPGVVKLIMSGGIPAKVPDQVIADIRKREHNGAVVLPKRALQYGDRGPLSGRLALFDDMAPRERVFVLLTLLGSERRLPSASVSDANCAKPRTGFRCRSADLWKLGARSLPEPQPLSARAPAGSLLFTRHEGGGDTSRPVVSGGSRRRQGYETNTRPFSRGFAMLHVPWYRRKDYRRIPIIMDDGDKFPKTFDEWERTAKRRLASAAAAGVTIEPVILDPGEFWPTTVRRRISQSGATASATYVRASFCKRFEFEKGCIRSGMTRFIVRRLAWT
jgi:transcriptional antiterminator RfaH